MEATALTLCVAFHCFFQNGSILIEGIPEACVSNEDLKGEVADFITREVKPEEFSIEQIDAAERSGDRPVRVTWTEQKTRDEVRSASDR